MTQSVFHRYHTEHEMLRYLRFLADRDLALDRTMIPLGSCTMKLNSTTEMEPVTWAEFSSLHPLVPEDESVGMRQVITELEDMLVAITGYDAVSLQPNAGSQGEFAGLMAIRAYHQSRGDHQREICLIPSSAHGTNAASAVMAGMKVVVVACDDNGNIDVNDLDRKLKSLKAIHFANLKLQPEYLYDVVQSYFFNPDTQQKYGYSYTTFKGHPNDAGYLALADYFADKIGLI
jgi:glycine dehydrogenase